MSAVRVTLESLRLSLSGISPETARRAVDGLGPELELRLSARLASSPSFGRGLEERGRRSRTGEPADRGAASGRDDQSLGTVEAKAALDAAGLRALIAERLLKALEDPATPASPGLGGTRAGGRG